MSALHEEFRTVPVRANVRGWQRQSWRAECKTCGWVGPERLHPLDCGPDSIEHTRETGGAA